MFRSTLCVFAAAAFAVAAPVRADEKLTPAELLKKAIAAAGGEAALKKYPAVREKGKGTLDIQGTEASFTSDSTVAADRMKAVLSIDFAGMTIKATQTVSGQKVRMTLNGMEMPLEEAPKAELRESLELRKVSLLTPLLEKDAFDLKVGEPAKVADADALVLIVKSRGLRETKVFFDAKTFLIVKLEKKGLDSSGTKEGNQETFLTDYKKVEGIMVPMKSRVQHDGKKYMEMETTEIKFLDKVPEDGFKMDD